ncbi:hypothetical protein PL263_00995 [Methylomonas sp. EFPC3]|uniref:hypothetical protein n=1 Tax=Methylomonas sp. EFPC3 TaxID=3021710 RepID=UPI002415F59D|nr:hypothetical protein [Methylomonas sp. EFPC3]WFP50614.1 hypothetical protein PL263_00995 [Methylomonas sp. EFPC3]
MQIPRQIRISRIVSAIAKPISMTVLGPTAETLSLQNEPHPDRLPCGYFLATLSGAGRGSREENPHQSSPKTTIALWNGGNAKIFWYRIDVLLQSCRIRCDISPPKGMSADFPLMAGFAPAITVE